MKRILIRADDLGYSEAVNYGIAKRVKEGIIRPKGVMTMPYSMIQIRHPQFRTETSGYDLQTTLISRLQSSLCVFYRETR